MAIKNAVQSTQTSMPRVTHLVAQDMATKSDVDIALIYTAGVLAISSWDLETLVNNTHQAKLYLLKENAKLPPPPTRAVKAETVETAPAAA